MVVDIKTRDIIEKILLIIEKNGSPTLKKLSVIDILLIIVLFELL